MTVILHVGRDRAHLEGLGVPVGRGATPVVTADGTTNHWCTPRSTIFVRGLQVDHIVWHPGWDDRISPARALAVRDEVLPAACSHA